MKIYFKKIDFFNKKNIINLNGGMGYIINEGIYIV